jgi:transposase-like protein
MRTNKKDQKAKREEKFRAAIRYYPVAFRWKLIQELAAELLTERQACEKYGITLILIRKWRRQYHERKIQPQLTTQPMNRKQSQAEEIRALKTKLAALEKQNERLRLEAHAHKTMVDIAEKELNISIRKKSGPAQ